jgi:hypothetical protein
MRITDRLWQLASEWQGLPLKRLWRWLLRTMSRRYDQRLTVTSERLRTNSVRGARNCGP